MAIKMKRSAVAAKAPTTSDLTLGELAVNTNDGKLYLKRNDGTEAIVEIGPVRSVAAKTGIITLEQADVSGLEAALSGKQDTSAKGQANGYAGLDGTGKVPEAQLPATWITEALTQAQAENPASTVFGTVSGERLGQHT